MELNLADLFESLADAIPGRTALAGHRRLTYGELEARANRLANALADRGIKAGDHVGAYLYNCAEFIEAVLAAFKIRAVPININYRYVEDELVFLLENAHCKALVYSARPRPARGRRGLPCPHARPLDLGRWHRRRRRNRLRDLLAAGSPERRFGPRSGDDLYIIYTGGTTGMPRGVMWRHEDVFYAGLQGGNPGGEPLGGRGGARPRRPRARGADDHLPRRAVHPRHGAVGGVDRASSPAARWSSRPARATTPRVACQPHREPSR